MQSDVPHPVPAHRESSKDYLLWIDIVSSPHRRQRFEDVGLSCPAIAGIGAPEYFERDEVLLGGNRLRALVGGDEAHLVEGRALAVQHHVQPHRTPPIRPGNDQSPELNPPTPPR